MTTLNIFQTSTAKRMRMWSRGSGSLRDFQREFVVLPNVVSTQQTRSPTVSGANAKKQNTKTQQQHKREFVRCLAPVALLLTFPTRVIESP